MKKELQLSLVKEELKSPALTKEQFMLFLKSFRSGKLDDDSYKKYLVNNFVTYCYADDERVTVVYDLFDHKNTMRYSEIRAILRKSNMFDQRNEWWSTFSQAPR